MELWEAMGWIARAVVFIHGHRVRLFYQRHDRAMDHLPSSPAAVTGLLPRPLPSASRKGRSREAIALGEQNNKSHLAKVLISGLHELQASAKGSSITEDTIEAARRALERATALGIEDLKRGLGGLATIGSTAPFVGLFGTTIGIINAFQGMKTEGDRGNRCRCGRDC